MYHANLTKVNPGAPQPLAPQVSCAAMSHANPTPQELADTFEDTLLRWTGPIIIATHLSPDADAIGSALALKRGLAALGKSASFVCNPPRYLQFLARADEYLPPLEALPENTLLVVLDVDLGSRTAGLPSSETGPEESRTAQKVVVIDHHSTNNGAGDLLWIAPQAAATAIMVKQLLDALGVTWSAEIATPCLAGILGDTGNFRFSNTTPDVLQVASELLACGVNIALLNDQMSLRHPDYFRMLGLVMSTVSFPFNGLAAIAELTQAMRDAVGPTDDDSNDYVGQIRYAEGVKVALFIREAPQEDGSVKVKLSVRSKDNVSARAICVALGGGGHEVAAGATLELPFAEAKQKVLEVVGLELAQKGYAI